VRLTRRTERAQALNPRQLLARTFATDLGLAQGPPMTVTRRRRPLGATVSSAWAGYHVVLVTDLIETGRDLSQAAELVRAHGCTGVDVVAVTRHGDYALGR